MEKIIVKKANKNIIKELNAIEFDKSYSNIAKQKYKGQLLKIFNLKPYEANILKQLSLSLGFDCAVHRDTITCKCETTDCLIFATVAQLKKLIKKLKIQPFKLKELANEIDFIISEEIPVLEIRNKTFNWENQYIMGILNITPDSFSDGGNFNTIEKAIAHVKKMLANGADIIDIGGESTRPNAISVSVDEEINRVIPIIEAIRKINTTIPISIDTRNYLTAKKAIEAGADIINDVSGLDYDDNLFKYVIEKNIPTIITHSNKIPAETTNFTNLDIVEEIYIDLKNKIEKLIKSGFERKNIIIDVGIGFGKDKESNFEILKRIEEFKSLNQALLIGISRKSFIKNEFNTNIEQIDTITALYSSILSNRGINIHRVHNVELTKEFIKYSSKI